MQYRYNLALGANLNISVAFYAVQYSIPLHLAEIPHWPAAVGTGFYFTILYPKSKTTHSGASLTISGIKSWVYV